MYTYVQICPSMGILVHYMTCTCVHMSMHMMYYVCTKMYVHLRYVISSTYPMNTQSRAVDAHQHAHVHVCTTLALTQTYGHAVGIHVFHVAHTCHVLCVKMALNMLIIGTYPYGHGMPYLDPLWTMYSTCPQHGCTSRYPISSLSTLRHVMYMLCTSLDVLLTVLILGPYLGTTLNWTLKRAILGQ